MKKVVLILVVVIIVQSVCIWNLTKTVKNHEHEVQVVEVYTPVIVEYYPEMSEADEVEEAEPVVAYAVPLSEELQQHIIKVCEQYGVDPEIVFAMAQRESSYKVDAVGDNGASIGLLQIQSKWHSERMKRLGCTNLYDPYQNVTVGVDYLAELLNRYGDMGKALTAYNRGSYVGTVTEYAQSILTMANELEETKYVQN